MKINWKLRFKNPAFWVFIVTLVVSNFASILNVNLVELTTWGAVWNMVYNAILNPTVLIPTLITVYLGAVDYSTKGICDSEAVLKATELVENK